jgi:hypothetical protein
MASRAGKEQPGQDRHEQQSLGVVSASLDHIAQFRAGSRWQDTLNYRLGREDPEQPGVSAAPMVRALEWITCWTVHRSRPKPPA